MMARHVSGAEREGCACVAFVRLVCFAYLGMVLQLASLHATRRANQRLDAPGIEQLPTGHGCC